MKPNLNSTPFEAVVAERYNKIDSLLKSKQGNQAEIRKKTETFMNNPDKRNVWL